MLKNWKDLFVKTDEEPIAQKKETESFSFPAGGNNISSGGHSIPIVTTQAANDPAIVEVLEVYEAGLDSINMPGYDFYEFYKAISTTTGLAGEQAYQMAYQMAKAFDKTITTQKLIHDAEFYISKINEVHGQYVSQGQQKLSSLQDKKVTEKTSLQHEIDEGARRVAQLKAELQQLETMVNQKKNTLLKIDESIYPQEKTIREKLHANDMAKKASIDKLNLIKEGIMKYIKVS